MAGGTGGSDPGAPPAARELTAACEAVLFATARPLSVGELARALGVSEEAAREAALKLQSALDREDRGLQVVEVAEGFQLVTRARYFPYLRRAAGIRLRKPALSAAALETLAVIAYRQPVTRSEIEALRGVNSESALATLLERGLIETAGRREGSGRPVLYRTTRRFLEAFGLRSLKDLPAVDRLSRPEVARPGMAELLVDQTSDGPA